MWDPDNPPVSEPRNVAPGYGLEVATFWHSIHVFSPLEEDDGQSLGYDSGGMLLRRVVGSFAVNATYRDGVGSLKHFDITEKRVSIWFTTSARMYYPVFQGLCLTDATAWCKAIYQLKPRAAQLHGDGGIRICRWYGGIAILQPCIIELFDVWHSEWDKMLNTLEKVLQVHVSSFWFIRMFTAKIRWS